MNKEEVIKKLKGQLIVSCQALPDEPLYSSFIMTRMAIAAMEGGAGGIRANSVADVLAIKEKISLPLIGIIKETYGENPVFITPTEKEVAALYEAGTEIIALDATSRIRPDGSTIQELFPRLKDRFPEQLFMADCASLKDARLAEKLGFDFVGTTLVGYTEETKDVTPPDMRLIAQLVEEMSVPVIAEGGIWSPQQLKEIMTLGVHAAVVGTAITRPREITQHFLQAMDGETR